VTATWTNFLSAEAGASAALAGLIFVAVSINIKKIIEYKGVPGRAAEALSLLIGVLLISTFGLAPNQSEKWLGSEILAIGGFLWLMTVVLQAPGLVVARVSLSHVPVRDGSFLHCRDFAYPRRSRRHVLADPRVRVFFPRVHDQCLGAADRDSPLGRAILSAPAIQLLINHTAKAFVDAVRTCPV
jgi:hypothetical protein